MAPVATMFVTVIHIGRDTVVMAISGYNLKVIECRLGYNMRRDFLYKCYSLLGYEVVYG